MNILDENSPLIVLADFEHVANNQKLNVQNNTNINFVEQSDGIKIKTMAFRGEIRGNGGGFTVYSATCVLRLETEWCATETFTNECTEWFVCEWADMGQSFLEPCNLQSFGAYHGDLCHL